MQVLAHWVVLLLARDLCSVVSTERVAAWHLLVGLVALTCEASVRWAELRGIRHVRTVSKVDVVVHVVEHVLSLGVELGHQIKPVPVASIRRCCGSKTVWPSGVLLGYRLGALSVASLLLARSLRRWRRRVGRRLVLGLCSFNGSLSFADQTGSRSTE